MCAKTKTIEEFNSGGYCKECHNGKSRSRHLMQEYGITVEQYNAMFDYQGGVCAICGEPPKQRRLAVDHRHSDGLTRGLLCALCNGMLGTHLDDVETFRRAVQFLEQPPAPVALGREVFGKKGKVRQHRGGNWVSRIYLRQGKPDSEGWREIR